MYRNTFPFSVKDRSVYAGPLTPETHPEPQVLPQRVPHDWGTRTVPQGRVGDLLGPPLCKGRGAFSHTIIGPSAAALHAFLPKSLVGERPRSSSTALGPAPDPVPSARPISVRAAEAQRRHGPTGSPSLCTSLTPSWGRGIARPGPCPASCGRAGSRWPCGGAQSTSRFGGQDHPHTHARGYPRTVWRPPRRPWPRRLGGLTATATPLSTPGYECVRHGTCERGPSR